MPGRRLFSVSARRYSMPMLCLAAEGVAIIIISSEMPELIGAADRIFVLREGVVMAEFDKSEATQDLIMQKAAYIKES